MKCFECFMNGPVFVEMWRGFLLVVLRVVGMGSFWNTLWDLQNFHCYLSQIVWKGIELTPETLCL
jgi:hypothetical protein